WLGGATTSTSIVRYQGPSTSRRSSKSCVAGMGCHAPLTNLNPSSASVDGGKAQTRAAVSPVGGPISKFRCKRSRQSRSYVFGFWAIRYLACNVRVLGATSRCAAVILLGRRSTSSETSTLPQLVRKVSLKEKSRVVRIDSKS